MDHLKVPHLKSARDELSVRLFDQGAHYRILFVGSSEKSGSDISSSLYRALRNLGHHVFYLDLAKHGEITDRPRNRGHGAGVAWLKPARLEALCARFSAQIVVLCTDRVALDAADAERLKQQGMVLIGFSASGPRDITSINRHADSFDIHAVDDHGLVGMYQGAGARNTLHLPPAVDRGFVTQVSAPAHGFASEVICIGDRRSEHRAMMAALARNHNVQARGPGRRFLGIKLDSAAHAEKAVRSGRVHVHVPGARARPVDIVRCVLESASAGALVCVGRSGNISDCFDYGSEIIGFRSPSDLIDQLSSVLQSPDRYREMTEAAFRRVAAGHLYEHRWMAMLETLFNCSPDTTPWLGEARIRSIRQTLGRSLPRCKPVIVSGYYGAGNLGDELILAAIERGLRSADAAVQITVAAENPVAVERDHCLQAFPRRDLKHAEHNARTAVATILGGGGLWHDYTFEKGGGLTAIFREPRLSMASFAPQQMLARFFETPCHVVGMGVGPISDPDAFRMLRFVADLADTIQVRDEQSRALLAKAGVATSKVSVAPDLAYSLPLPVSQIRTGELQSVWRLKDEGYTVVGVNIRPWSFCDEDALISRLVQGLKSAVGAAKLAIVTIPMQGVDNAALSKFLLACGADVKRVELKSPLSLEDLGGAMAACDVLLSMRLHACLIAHRLGRPVVGIAYDPKVANHFDEIGRAQFALPIDAPADAVGAALGVGLSDQAHLPVETRQILATLESQAREALEGVARRIAGLPPSDRIVLSIQPLPPTERR